MPSFSNDDLDNQITRRDPESDRANPIRRDAAATRRDELTHETRRDEDHSDHLTRLDSDNLSRHIRTNLPPKLDTSYETVKQLPTQGGEADLILVKSRSDDNEYVIKLYRAGIIPKPDVAETIQSISQSHPDYFIRLLEYDYSGEWAYEILEYAPNGSLAELIVSQPQFNESQIRLILQQLSEAIDCLHQNQSRIVHRDLKPSNILIRQPNPLKVALIDFGIASLLDAGTIRQTSLNRTVSYAPPEAQAGKVSPAFDYWSLGIIVVELLTGKHPFEGLSDSAVNAQLIENSVNLSKVTNFRWQQLCQGLLKRDSKKRWGKTQIDRWLAGENLPVESDEYAVRQYEPYLLSGKKYNTPEELAIGLAENWDDGIKRFGRGSISEWIKQSVKNEDLYHDLLDIERSEQQENLKLLLAIARLNPNLEPTYRNHVLTPGGLLTLSQSKDTASTQVIDFLFVYDILNIYGQKTGKKEYESIHVNWCQAVREFHKLLTEVKSSDEVFNSLTEPSSLRGDLLGIVVSEANLRVLRREVTKVATPEAQESKWFYNLNRGEIEQATPAALYLMLQLADIAVQATTKRFEGYYQDCKNLVDKIKNRLTQIREVDGLIYDEVFESFSLGNIPSIEVKNASTHNQLVKYGENLLDKFTQLKRLMNNKLQQKLSEDIDRTQVLLTKTNDNIDNKTIQINDFFAQISELEKKAKSVSENWIFLLSAIFILPFVFGAMIIICQFLGWIFFVNILKLYTWETVVGFTSIVGNLSWIGIVILCVTSLMKSYFAKNMKSELELKKKQAEENIRDLIRQRNDLEEQLTAINNKIRASNETLVASI
jgi:serine/threonine protein kinase